MSGQELRKLPSPYYRVTTRAIVLDERMRILIIENENGSYELPGGGWEHNESFEACLTRELQEELGVEPLWIGGIWFCYRGKRKGWPWHLRLCAPVLLKDGTAFTLGEGMKDAYFVTRQVFLNTKFAIDDEPVKEHADKIWRPVEKKPENR